MRQAWIGLVHHPVLDRAGDTITTAVTNLDVHDIARTARTYGLAGYFVITPLEAQHQLVARILEHWRSGAGAKRVPERTEALRFTEVVSSIEDAVAAVTERASAPQLYVTSAREGPEGVPVVSYADAGAAEPALVLFGTGHGLHPDTHRAAHGRLPAIEAASDYNHLSVRAAVAITLDRLYGAR